MNRQLQIDAFLLAAHRLGMQRLRADPSRLRDVAGTLARWRSRAGGTRADRYWDEWQALLDGGLDALEAAVCGVDDRATALRNVSPFASLITQQERGELLRASRAGALS
ncbi:MAG: hypothetical protein REJ24_14630 [Rhodocyclaceae bacterium]|nr:hypothetical protein [Pseudomonadota bacterium]MDQ7973801.1 hypothetical protein [Rhodocyclaceae bacterium]